jgi:malonate decarboxylase gamma subunit
LRGLLWLRALTNHNDEPTDAPTSVRIVDAPLGEHLATFIAVVPNPQARFPRARTGEVGLEEGWALSRHLRHTIAADRNTLPRPIIAIVDVVSQAFGRREEQLGIHLACAAAADAYAAARLAGHPVIALLVGKAMSGAFLAHGYQANRILALDSPQVLVHAMSRHAAARVTRRTLEELDQIGQVNVPMAYDIRSYAKLGLLHELIEGVDADDPDADGVERVRVALLAAIADARTGPRDLSSRLASEQARQARAASIEVRRRLAQQWDEV